MSKIKKYINEINYLKKMDYLAQEDLVYKAIDAALSAIGHPFGEREFIYYVRRNGTAIQNIRPKPYRTISPDKQGLVPLFESRVNEEFRKLCRFSAHLSSN